MAEETFEQCLTEVQRLCNRNLPTVEALHKHCRSLLASVTSMLDIGPGEGVFDALLIEKLLPELHSFYAVEVDADLCKQLERRLSNLGNRFKKINITNALAEDYNGPHEPVDLVLISHMLYYPQDRMQLLKRALSWVKPQGHLVVVENGPNEPLFIALEAMGLQNYKMDVRSLLSQVASSYEVHRTSHLHMYPDWYSRKGLHVMLKRPPTKAEIDNFEGEMKPFCKWRNGQMSFEQDTEIFVIAKKK